MSSIAILTVCSIYLLTVYLLNKDEDITISFMKSYLLGDKYDRKTTAYILALIFPITLTHYLVLKNKNKMNLKKLIIGSLLAVIFFVVGTAVWDQVSQVIDFSNKEVALTTEFKQLEQERITFYDKAYDQVAGTSQIALRNDSSFYHIVDIVMLGQPQNLSAFMGAIRLIDPSANYTQVSSFYQQLLELANNNSEGFFQQEKALQSVNAQHENLLKQFPGSLYNTFLRRNSFKYTPILSTVSKQVQKTNTHEVTRIFK